MKHPVMISCEDSLSQALAEHRFDQRMHSRLVKGGTPRALGLSLDAQQPEAPAAARAVRMRGRRTGVLDGRWVETRRNAGGCHPIEATGTAAAGSSLRPSRAGTPAWPGSPRCAISSRYINRQVFEHA